MSSRHVFMASVAFAVTAIAAGPQEPQPRLKIRPKRSNSARSASLAPVIRHDVKLIQVPVTVTDGYGAPVSGLPREAFRLFENGVEQEVKHFGAIDSPVSLGIVFDASRSMEERIGEARSAVSRFFTTTIPGDEFFLVEFNDAPRLLCGFTEQVASIQSALAGTRPRNWTALFDAVYLAMQQMKRAKNSRRAILILSDGADNNSRYTGSEMKSAVQEADVVIYAIGLTGGGLMQRHVSTLRNLTEETGGALHRVRRIADLPDAVAQVSAAIRNQYFLGYSSTEDVNDGRYRGIDVKLAPTYGSQLRVSWRRGYYALDGS